MRLIGSAERAMEMMLERVTTRKAFGKLLVEQSLVRDDLAECRMQIDQARLLTLHCANAMDNHGNKVTRDLIAMIKVVCPRMACNVIDRALQTHGGMGVCQVRILLLLLLLMLPLMLLLMLLLVLHLMLWRFVLTTLCQDTPLASMWTGARSLRLADGPDEVHKQTIALLELRRASQRDGMIPGPRL